KDQPAGKVLDLVLSDGSWIATRDGTLVSLKRDEAAAPVPGHKAEHDRDEDRDRDEDNDRPEAPEPPEAPSIHIPPVPPIPPIPSMHGKHGKKGEDRFITGSNLTIGKDETAHDVTVFGGNLEIYGTVTGDVSVTGGNVNVHRDAKIKGDLSGVGGNVNV